MDPTDPRIQAGAAVVGALAPMAGPWGAVASTVLSSGLAFWADYSSKMAAGTLTEDDVRAAAGMTGSNLDNLRAEVEAREKAGK